MTEPGPSRLLRTALVAATFVVLAAIAWVLASVVRSTMAPGAPAQPVAATDTPRPSVAPAPEPPASPVSSPMALRPVPEEILRVGGEVAAPVRLSGRDPRYTEAARRAGIQGVVILEAVIDREGRVTASRVLKNLPMGLDREAQEAVKEWRFQPATRGGQPVSVYFALIVEFKLR